MTFMKNLVFATIFIISCTNLFAQNKEEPNKREKKWYVKGTLQHTDTQALTIIEYASFKNGVFMVNNTGAIEWDILIDGCILGISKYNGNLLVFYTARGTWDRINNSIIYPINKINVATIDIKSQKIIDDKIVYKGRQYVIPYIQNDVTGNFNQLLIRSTQYAKKVGKTKWLTSISLTSDGNVVNKNISSIAIEGSYIGNSAGKDGSFFIASFVNEKIVIEKFNHDGELISKLESSPLDMQKKSKYRSVMTTDTFTNNAVLLNLRVFNKEKTKAFSNFRFNFDDSQVTTVNETPLNKTSSYKFDHYTQLEPIEIFFTNDKIVMAKEVRFTEIITGSSGRAKIMEHGESLVLSIFDKQMKLLHDVVIPKATVSYSKIDVGLGCHIHKDKMYILSGENYGMGTFENYCYTVNLNDGKWEKRKIGSNKPSMETGIYAQGTIWFANKFVMSHLHIGGGFFAIGIQRYSTELESISYDAP